ncbi:IS30 family transposase, partial [Limosilactobacillus fermentum]
MVLSDKTINNRSPLPISHILTLSDRTVIQTLLKVGYSQKQIAEEVGVAPSTINYELKR